MNERTDKRYKMSKIESFEDLEMWKESMRLCIGLYGAVRECKDYGFKDQIQRASLSVPSNIAEGFERQSDKEFVHFLYIAKGSCGEVRTQLYLAKELKYINQDDFTLLLDQSKHISSMIANYIKVRKQWIDERTEKRKNG